jgi:uncharacterized protein
MMRAKRAIAMLAKVPHVVPVKTRLVPPLTTRQAQTLASAFIRDLATRLVENERLLDAKATVFYAPPGAEDEMAALVPGIRIAPQVGLELGQRLSAAVQQLHRDRVDRIVVIGGDSPTLPARRIACAFDTLDAGADLAIAGAEDGGYVLLGLSGAHVALFERIPWSTPAVYAATLKRARNAGLRTVELDPWYDVDDAASLERLRRELRGHGEIGDDAPHTRAALMSFDA